MNDLVSYKILLVDDTESNIDILVDTLGDTYELSIATSGEQALNRVLDDTPDLILLDVMMPGLNGFEVCLELKSRELTSEIPIIFVTSKSDPADEQNGLEAGAVDYIAKPFSPAIVRARVKNHLLIKHQKDQLKKSISTLHHEAELLQQKAEMGIQAGGLAHDMANVLTPAKALLGLFPRTQPKDEDHWQKIVEHIDMIKESTKLGIEICRGFTNYLKDIGEGPALHSFIEFLPSINMYAMRFRGKLIKEINDAVPLIKCKGYQIKRVIVNLFVNAIQAIENQKDPRIILRLWHEADRVFFSIRDNGTGIGPEILPHIFEERFTTKAAGTGLGLFLIKQIIDTHNGKIEVFSRINEGTEFVISFKADKD